MEIIDHAHDWWSYATVKISLKQYFPDAKAIIIEATDNPHIMKSDKTSYAHLVIDDIKYILNFDLVTYDADRANISWSLMLENRVVCSDFLSILRYCDYLPQIEQGATFTLIDKVDSYFPCVLANTVLYLAYSIEHKWNMKQVVIEEYRNNVIIIAVDGILHKIQILHTSCQNEFVHYHFELNMKIEINNEPSDETILLGDCELPFYCSE